jgi:20S proteasome alpha/beta subunit
MQTMDKAIDAAIWSIRHAAHRDAYSGGFINVVIVNATGCHHVRRVNSKDLRISTAQNKIEI